MGRQVRIVQIPLEPFQGKFYEAVVTNPRLSHWALLFGEPGSKDSFLIEMFPKAGKSKRTPLTYLVHSRPANLEGRRHKFKFGIFSQPDSDKTDEEIIAEGQKLIDANPIYLLWPGYNCQNFVNDLVEKLREEAANRSWVNFLRKWTPLGSLLWRGPAGPTEIEPGSKEEDEQALAELGLFMAVGEQWAAAADATVWSSESVPDVPVEEGHLSMFKIRDQPYTKVEAAVDLEEFGVVYEGQEKEDLAREMAGIPGDQNLRYLDDEQTKDLSIAEALVGED